MVFFLNVKEIAELLGVHVNTIYNNINNGQIKAVKINGSWDISEEEFLKLKREQRMTPRLIIDSMSIVIDLLENQLNILKSKLNYSSGLDLFVQFKEYEKILAAKNIIEDLKSTWHSTINEQDIDLDAKVDLFNNLSEEEAIKIYNTHKEIEDLEKTLANVKVTFKDKLQKWKY